MNKILLTYDEKVKGRTLYAYSVEGGKIKNIPIKSMSEIESLLKAFASSNIDRINRKNNNAKEIVFDNGLVLVIDDNRVFSYTGHVLDSYIGEIKNKIIEYRDNKRKLKEQYERTNIKKYRDSLPKGYVPKVNRKRSNQFGKILVAGGALVILATGAFVYNLRDVSATNVDKEISIVNSVDKLDVPIIPDDFYLQVNDKIESEKLIIKESTLSLDFNDRSDDGKLANTESYYGDIIDFYSKRYGLPYNLNCAQITQERPNIVDGKCENLCQIEDSHLGENFHVPVYDENGFTGTYDDFKVTKEMLATPEGSIMIQAAYDRKCVDKYDNLILGYFFYNHGPNSLKKACEYYEVSIDEYIKPENVIAARDLIVQYYKEIKPKGYGDPKYLENIFSYLRTEDRGSVTFEYYLGNELKTLTLTNTNLIDKSVDDGYNNNLVRG